MKRVVCSLALSVLAMATVAQGQTVFTLGLSGQDTVSGGAGDSWSSVYTATLGSEGGGAGAQGWSISLSADGASISDITTDGTDVDGLFSGGFKKSELTTKGAGDCAGKNGAVSAVVLSFTEPVTLPAAPSSAAIALVSVGGTIPDGAERCGTATLGFVNNCQGAGQPVQNNITQDGATVTPVLGSKTINLCKIVTCCKDTDVLNVGFTRTNVSSANPYEGVVDDGAGLCSGGGGEVVIEVPEGETGAGSVFAAISSRGAGEGVQGWSFSFGIDGGGTLTSATTNGTSVDRLFAGGFKKTEVIDPAKNGGLNGAVSAVVLSFTEPVVLPATGTESVAELAVVSNSTQGADDIVATVSFKTGLRGSGQPVQNAITLGGATVGACNFDTASVNVIFRAITQQSFIRGNANDDSKVNIADAIWIINELFKGGAATVCRDAADVNDDGLIDLADATFLINHQFVGGPTPPAPYPDCGLDEGDDADGLPCDVGQAVCD